MNKHVKFNLSIEKSCVKVKLCINFSTILYSWVISILQADIKPRISMTSVPNSAGDLMPTSGLCGHWTHIVHIHTSRQTLMNIKSFKKNQPGHCDDAHASLLLLTLVVLETVTDSFWKVVVRILPWPLMGSEGLLFLY